MNKIFYDGDASKIIAEHLILELIQERKIIVRDNKILTNIIFNKGTTRSPMPIYAIGHDYAECMYKKAFEGSWIYKDEKDVMRIDYDLEILEKMLKTEHGDNIEIVQSNNRVGYRLIEGDVENDNGTFKESICESDM